MSVNCYSCPHHANVPGNAHLMCKHPLAKGDAIGELLALFADAGRVQSPVSFEAARTMGVRLNAYGVRNGWASWPWCFDPTWVDSCNFAPTKPVVQEHPL